MSKKYDQLKKQMETLREEMKTEAKKTFQEESKEMFERFPDLTSFSWRQYTPYFNDGSPCTFRVSSDYPSLNDLSDEDEYVVCCPDCDKEEYVGWEERRDRVEKTCPTHKKTMTPKVGDRKQYEKMKSAVIDFLGTFEDNVFEEMFGDHKTVTVNRKGVKIENYEHD